MLDKPGVSVRLPVTYAPDALAGKVLEGMVRGGHLRYYYTRGVRGEIYGGVGDGNGRGAGGKASFPLIVTVDETVKCYGTN